MKIDLEMLEAMVASGATGAMVLAMVRLQCEREEIRLAAKRPKEKVRKQRTRAGQKRTRADNHGTAMETDRQEATVTDTPRARLFREGKPALLTMNIAPSRAGALITEWLKLTNDDDQLVLATILKAQSLAVHDAPGWILATLKGRINGNGTGADRANPAAGQSGSATIMAGVAAAAERRGRERAASRPDHRPPPRDADIAREPDFEFGGTADG